MHRKAISLRTLLVFSFLFCILGITASCGSMGMGNSEKKDEENFKNSVDAFNRAFRWEDYDSAAVFITPAKKEGFWREVDRYKGKIRLIDFQVRDVFFDQLKGTGTAIIWFQYFRTNQPTIQTVTFSQKWHYVEKTKMWMLSKSGFEAISGSQTDL